MSDQTVVVFDKNTKEVVACIPLSGGEAICRNDVDFKIYNDTEPLFKETPDTVILDENAFTMKWER